MSFYYKPDLCAGSFRCTALIDELKKRKNLDIEIITTQPNRYASYSAGASNHQKQDALEVHRVELPQHSSGMLDQIRAFIVFYRKAHDIVKNKQYDMVYATSSRLFTAFLGARISKRKRLPLYLDIRDIFVDTIKDVLPRKVAFLSKPIFSLIEYYSFSQAGRVNLVSEGFREYFESRFPSLSLRFYTNGIDQEFIKPLPAINNRSNKVIRVVYAGNIGEGQGLHNIIPNLASRLSGKVQFILFGDGGRKLNLERAVKGLNNVTLNSPVSREQLINEYMNADVLFLHLNNYPAFEKVLPSKIFEYGALGKPIWAGLAGYPAKFANAELENCSVFNPSDADDAIRVLGNLQIKDELRENFINKFSRESIMSRMADDIMDFATQNKLGTDK